MAANCLTCEFYAEQGECRRYPPTLVLQGVNHIALWPTVNDDDWCGEFKAGDGGGTTPAITLTSLTPNNLTHGTTPATIDIVGTGFDNTCIVYADGQSRAAFFLDPTHLQYTARPDLQPAPITVQVTVKNGAGDVSNALPFNFT